VTQVFPPRTIGAQSVLALLAVSRNIFSDAAHNCFTCKEASLEQALITMTKQQSPDASVPIRVYYYNLKRMTQKYISGQKDEWSLPGETGDERALAYFERDAGFSNRLEVCEEGDVAAEFILEKRERLLTQFGAS
jgi:hypothetical protein